MDELLWTQGMDNVDHYFKLNVINFQLKKISTLTRMTILNVKINKFLSPLEQVGLPFTQGMDEILWTRGVDNLDRCCK